MIDDDRGRVPFAVIGVLLLVGSATVATTVSPTPPPDEPTVDVVIDRIEAEQRTALRRAVRAAADGAAGDPVIEPANTTVGNALGGNRTFERSLRLRVYVAAREQLGTIDRRRGDVIAATTLPEIDASSESNVARAIERVELERVGENGTALKVSVGNVTTSVHRGDRLLRERTTVRNVSVATPVLALHDRVAAYERRLNAGVTNPGLEQRLTALLNAAGWARGYAQYYGAPIDNVVSNRHVGVATNAVLLDVQRATIGRVDPKGVRTLTRDLGKLAAEEILAIRAPQSPSLQRALANQSVVAANDIDGIDVPARDEPMTVGINRTAEDVFLSMVREAGYGSGFLDFREGLGLDRVLERSYSANVTLVTRTTGHSGGPPSSSPPGAGWTRVGSGMDRSVSVTAGGPVVTPSRDGWHPLESYSRRVVTRYELTTTWTRAGRVRTTRSTGRETETVSVTVLGRHAPAVPGPDGRIRGIHQAGEGPLDGPNLAGVEAAAMAELVGSRGGKEAVARKAVDGSLESNSVTIAGERPAELREWVYRDLMDLRETVSDLSVSVDRRDVGTFAVNPPRRLERKLAKRRAELLDASPPYDGVADRARIAARAKYLSLVAEALDARAVSRAGRRGTLGNALDSAGAGSVDDLQRSVQAAVGSPGERQPALAGPGGPVRLRVDAAPAYLTLSSVEPAKLAAIENRTHPLVARNVNLFTLSYGDHVGGFLDAIIGGPDRTSLASAAHTLRSSEEFDVSDAVDVGGVSVPLEAFVARKVDAIEAVAARTLRVRGVGEDAAERREIVRSGLARWEGTADRAIAISNGSGATAIVSTVSERTDLTTVERDRLALELDRSVRDALERAKGRPRTAVVEEVAKSVKARAGSAIRDVAERYQDRVVDRVGNGTLSTLPSGLPLAPVPGYWYATTNVWHVQVEGEYARFGVRATRGRPSDPGAGLAYARDGENVTLDVDHDGTPERLGRSRRVQFAATVDVVVVVPPGPQGVGDVAGPTDERSDGWPRAGE